MKQHADDIANAAEALRILADELAEQLPGSMKWRVTRRIIRETLDIVEGSVLAARMTLDIPTNLG